MELVQLSENLYKLKINDISNIQTDRISMIELISFYLESDDLELEEFLLRII